jgi:hypothetical protein
MHLLAAAPDISPITDLITTWIHIGQALVGSVGALAFIFAFQCMYSHRGNENSDIRQDQRRSTRRGRC